MSRLTLETSAKFIWFWNHQFFLETDVGNFVWSDPQYGGDNTIKPFDGDYEDFCIHTYCDYGREKGKHLIGDYCGKDVKLL